VASELASCSKAQRSAIARERAQSRHEDRPQLTPPASTRARSSGTPSSAIGGSGGEVSRMIPFLNDQTHRSAQWNDETLSGGPVRSSSASATNESGAASNTTKGSMKTGTAAPSGHDTRYGVGEHDEESRTLPVTGYVRQASIRPPPRRLTAITSSHHSRRCRVIPSRPLSLRSSVAIFAQ